VGNYAIAQNNPTAGDNYDLLYVGSALTITPAPLTVNVDSTWRFAGQPNPTFSGSISGQKNGDIVTAVFSSNANLTSPAGDYAIDASVSGSKLGNYAVTVHDGTLQVVPPACLAGFVFKDFNDDGSIDFGEAGIAGVTIRL